MAIPYQLPSSFSGGMQGAVESLKKGTLPQSVMSPVVKPAQVKQTTKLPQKKTGYVPLTREQFMKAQESGITPDQIIEFEKRRKSEMEAPQAPKFDRSNPEQFVKDYEQSVQQGNPRAVATGAFSGITKGIGNIAQFVEKTPSIGEMIFGKQKTNLPSIADPIQKGTNTLADMATKKLGVNPDSNFYKGGEFAGQIALTNALLPGVGGATGLGSKVLAGATEGALQGGAFDVVNQGKVTKENVGLGLAIGGALPLVGAGLSKGKEYFTSKLPAKLQLQGLMNPAKVTMLKKQLQTDGVATPEDVAKWMIDRNIKGDKETIIKTLISRAEQSKQAVDDSLAAVSKTVESNIAKNALQQSYDDVSKIAGLEDEASKILSLLNKDTYTLSELNQVKRILDDQYNLFTKTGDPTAGLKAKGLQGIRQQLRQTIEDVADKAGIKNIKALNNETQIARGMADAIARKDSADAVREALTAFAPTGVGGIIGGVAGPFDNNTVEGKVGNILLGMLVGRVAGSTTLKTNVASLLSKLSKKEIGALDAYIQAGGKSVLPVQILEKIDDTIKLLPPASGLPTSANVVDVKPMTGFLPGVLQKQSQAVSSKVGTQPLTTSLPKSLSKSEISSEASTVLPKQKPKVNIPGNKVNTPIIPKTEVKANLPKTPQVEGKTEPTRITIKDGAEWTPDSKIAQDIFYVDRNGIRQTEFESTGKNVKGQRAGYTMEEYLKKNGLSKDDFTLNKGTDGADGLYTLNEKGLSKLEKLRVGTKPKPPLPLSQKSEVKYQTIDNVDGVPVIQSEGPSFLDTIRSPEYKARMAEASKTTGRVTKTSNNLYHTTKAENLDSIMKNGLQTGHKPRFEGVSSPKKISFSANEEGASYYGGPDDVMIRTKRSYKPDDLEIDYLAGGEGTYTTGKNIPPEMLEVKIKGKWIPLLDYKK